MLRRIRNTGSRRPAAFRSLRLHGAEERELRLLGELERLGDLGFGHLEGIDARDRVSVRVRVQHEARRVAFRLVEDVDQDEDDELHRRVVVVVQEDFVELRALEPGLGPGLRLGGRDTRVFFLLGTHRARASACGFKIGDSASQRASASLRSSISARRASRMARSSLASPKAWALNVSAGKKPLDSLCSPPAPPSKARRPRAMQSWTEW